MKTYVFVDTLFISSYLDRQGVETDYVSAYFSKSFVKRKKITTFAPPMWYRIA